MGDPKKRRKKYMTPNHPWQKTRIIEETESIKSYGLKNKKEIWKAASIVRNFRTQAKKLSSQNSEQTAKETTQLLTKLRRLGLLNEEGTLDDVLSLKTTDILERRLQTIVYRKGLAKSMKQARQFITHEHITINGIKIKTPGHLVTIEEQPNILFRENSKLADPEHPERKLEEIKEISDEEIEKKEEENNTTEEENKKTPEIKE